MKLYIKQRVFSFADGNDEVTALAVVLAIDAVLNSQNATSSAHFGNI